jgi:hypothetical protein
VALCMARSLAGTATARSSLLGKKESSCSSRWVLEPLV